MSVRDRRKDEKVTQETGLVHAWGDAKAVEYLASVGLPVGLAGRGRSWKSGYRITAKGAERRSR